MLVVNRILPGAALSILAGNLFYAWQARRLMARTGRDDVTAIPYGINTVSLIAFALMVMAPGYTAKLATPNLPARRPVRFHHQRSDRTDRSVRRRLAAPPYAAGGAAHIAGGRRHHLHRHGFVFQIFASPAIAVCDDADPGDLRGRIKLPLGGAGRVGGGVARRCVAWISRGLGAHWFQPAPLTESDRAAPAGPAFHDALALLTSPHGWKYMPSFSR